MSERYDSSGEEPESSDESSDVSSSFYRRSESPLEDWGSDGDKDWPVEVIGEEVDYWGKVRHEVAWDGWNRKDGTNTTWKEEYVDKRQARFISDWDRRQKTRRRNLAEEDEYCSIEVHTGLDIHNTETRLRAQAYEEKLAIAKKYPCNWAKERVKIIQEREESLGMSKRKRSPEGHSESRKLRETAERRKHRESSVSHSVTSSSRAPSSSQAPVSSASTSTSTSRSATVTSASSPTPTLLATRASSKLRTSPSESLSSLWSQEVPLPQRWSKPPLSEKARGKQPVKETFPSPKLNRAYVEICSPKHIQAQLRRKSKRQLLSEEWSEKAGFSITFVNEVDDEEIPSLPAGFEYREQGYKFSDDIEKPGPDWFTTCECERNCKSPHACNHRTYVLDEEENKIFAYDSKGLFRFDRIPRGTEVIECNERCPCDDSCRNRVVQRPKTQPIVIFKTKKCGWGVRSTKNVRRGQVLGTYTGLLITRERANEEELVNYCFDLDGHELFDETSDDEGAGYTVDSWKDGNWTRFINHSCSPNLQTFLVTYDTIPETGMYYVAFVANQDIPAGTEFTFDYNPLRASQQPSSPQSSPYTGSQPRTNIVKCRCGSPQCRGTI
ncbi:histone-lysine N-methyltransferase [Coprinopsis cinerea AmutBmut pab1-1]|nr:histone-lysine N-methyltransferase [Coprinopsis cinerea AmutBmut pab1-1]